MACREIDQMRRQVCDVMRGTVDTWQYNLQARWGDPRVYEAQKEELARRDARVAHDLSRRNTDLLAEAYANRAAAQEESHKTRMSELRSQNYRKSGKRPQSAAARATRTA